MNRNIKSLALISLVLSSLTLDPCPLSYVFCQGPGTKGQGSVGRERVVIRGQDEPNTPPNAPVSEALRAVITDPAAFRDGVLDLNQAIYVRLFDRQRTAPPRVIAIMIPDIISGANAFNVLGSQLVQRSGGEMEVWAMERRANLLEDALGMLMAENARTSEAALAALDFYMNDPHGQGGYIANQPTQVHPFMAEWGLDVHLRDLRAVVNQARQAAGMVRPRVYLCGHGFFGASLAALFAAYNFDGTAGYTLIDGLILLDGAPAPNAPPPAPRVPSDDDYLNNGVMLGTLPVPGLNQLRDPQSANDAPFLRGDVFGPFSFQLVEILAQLALFAPDAASPLPGDLAPPVPSTNAATLAINIDDEFAEQAQTRFSLGFLRVLPGRTVNDVAIGRPDPERANPNGLFTPRNLGTDASGQPILQRWDRLTDLSSLGLRGREVSDINTVAQGFLYGQGDGRTSLGEANFVEWFFPVRLILDIVLTSNLDTSRLSPRLVRALTARGGNPLTVTENRRVNLPILGLRADQGILVVPPPLPGRLAFQPYQVSVPAARFRVAEVSPYTHNDVLSSADPAVPDLIIGFINGM